MFVRVIPKPVIDEIPFLIFLPIILSPASTKISLFEVFYSFAANLTNNINPWVSKLKTSGRLNKSPPDFIILDNWVFKNFVLADGLFEKALRIFETYLSVNNNNLCGKLVSSLEFPIKFYERLKVSLVSLFIPDFNLLSCASYNFTFKMLYWVIFILIFH